MKKIPVRIDGMQDAKHLVQIAEKSGYDVDLQCGRYIVNAKSMLGVFSLPHFDEISLLLHTPDEAEAEWVKSQLALLKLLKK